MSAFTVHTMHVFANRLSAFVLFGVESKHKCSCTMKLKRTFFPIVPYQLK